MLSPIARAAPNDTVAIPKTIVILIAKLLPINRRPYTISDGELKLARFRFCYNVERPLPDGRAISGAIMPPLGFLSKAKPLLLRRPILRKCHGVSHHLDSILRLVSLDGSKCRFGGRHAPSLCKGTRIERFKGAHMRLFLIPCPRRLLQEYYLCRQAAILALEPSATLWR